MDYTEFIENNYPGDEETPGLLEKYKDLKSLVENEFQPGSNSAVLLNKIYGNDIRSLRIKYDFLEL